MVMQLPQTPSSKCWSGVEARQLADGERTEGSFLSLKVSVEADETWVLREIVVN